MHFGGRRVRVHKTNRKPSKYFFRLVTNVFRVFSSDFFFSSIQFASEPAPAATSARQMPYGYFRTFTLQPFLTYPPPTSPYSSFYSPLTNWPNEYLPSPPIPAPSFYTAPASYSSTHKPTSAAPSSTQPSLLNFQTLFKSLTASASKLLESVPVSSASSTTTPQPTTTTAATTSTTTTTTTTTTESPTTSTIANSVEHTIPLVLNRLGGAGDSRHLEKPSQPSRAPIMNRRSDISSPWPYRSSYQQPRPDALFQQYFSNFLAAPHMHVVPCMCSMTLGIPPMASMTDYLAPSTRSDDEDVESDSMDGVIDDQSIVNKLIEWDLIDEYL